MARKNFRATGGIDIDSSAIPTTVIQETITSNSAVTVDTIALDSFISSEYTITLKQGSKIRTSKVIMQTDGTSVDMTEFAITETGGTISGVVVSATTASTNAILQITVTDAETTLVRYKLIKNISTTIQYAPDAPTIGTATAGPEQVSLTFTAPVDTGNSAISTYTAISNPGNITGSGSSSPITILGLSSATSYTFTVTATNSFGTSAASAASDSVTPNPVPIQAGYTTGNASGSRNSTVDKMVFSTETASVITSTSNNLAKCAFSNSGTAGYVISQSSTTLDKYNYTDDVRSSLSNGVSFARDGIGTAFANSGTAGYRFGGHASTSVSTNARNATKLDFSNETSSTISNWSAADIWLAEPALAGGSNNGVAGYIFGGANLAYGSNTRLSTIRKVLYSNDSVSTIAATLTNAVDYSGSTSVSNSGTACYTNGGYYGDNLDKILFSNDTKSTVAMSNDNTSKAGNAKSGTAGYFSGGDNRNVNKLTFSTETESLLSNVISSTPRYLAAGFSNTGTL